MHRSKQTSSWEVTCGCRSCLDVKKHPVVFWNHYPQRQNRGLYLHRIHTNAGYIELPLREKCNFSKHTLKNTMQRDVFISACQIKTIFSPTNTHYRMHLSLRQWLTTHLTLIGSESSSQQEAFTFQFTVGHLISFYCWLIDLLQQKFSKFWWPSFSISIFFLVQVFSNLNIN